MGMTNVRDEKHRKLTLLAPLAPLNQSEVFRDSAIESNLSHF